MASKEIEYSNNTFSLSYELVNPSQERAVLILHGWGSNKEIMKQAFGKLLPDCKHIYLDMPGFGKSSNDTILRTGDYMQIVRLFLETLSVVPQIIMGHSFGGKVATLLDPPCLVLLSSSGVLIPKPFFVRLKITLTKMFKAVGIGRFGKIFSSKDVDGMSHEMYETFKNVVNEQFEEHFLKVNGKVLLFWGKSDTATPIWTAEKIVQIIPGATLYPLEGDHYFFLQHAPFIAQTVLDQYKDNHSCRH
ncbi:MAG: alpha/beta hydrolase [Sulfurovum sp.]|nr:alpha/beta hydrolase [Sulfurovum sp.]MCB4750732.1 alpha/beta hydrolase [Sulfurovum sp.]MCB4753742.1 alpha/beta hydrolase [Sulfurovum sp.]MCB4754948.1 alpha/beta hydrolase [Sulfurovum sp.]MCB4761528.1 alpha/beta hydrolase [Sulfurovum sp.]